LRFKRVRQESVARPSSLRGTKKILRLRFARLAASASLRMTAKRLHAGAVRRAYRFL